MRFAQLESGTVRLVDVPEPHAGPGELVVRMAACGVCGTDLEKLKGNYRASSVLGHEPVGLVSEVGSGVSSYAVGDRVFVHHHVPCGVCAVCVRGDPTFCPTYATTNLDPGGFSESFRVSAHHVRAHAVLRLAPGISWDEGSLLEPAGCVVTALHRVGFSPGMSVFVYGLGPAGLLYARLARAMGATWVGGAELSPRRRAVAEAGGIDAVVDPRDPKGVSSVVENATEGRGVDLAVVATSAPAAIQAALEIVRRAGTVNLFGVPATGSRLDYDLLQLFLRGIRIVPTYATTEPDIREVHAQVAARRLRLADLVSDRFPLSDIASAFARARDAESSVKVVVTGPAY